MTPFRSFGVVSVDGLRLLPVSDADPAASPRPRAVPNQLRQAPAWQVWVGLLIVYVVWGSTYLGIRVVVETMPPLISVGIRFLLAAVIMGIALVVLRGPSVLRVRRSALGGAIVVGILLLGGGNGGVMLGERDVASGTAALIVGVVPVMVLIVRRLTGEAIDRIQALGVLGGLVGLVVLVAPLGLNGEVSMLGIGFLVASTVAWSLGSVASSRIEMPSDPFVSTFYQFLAGATSGFLLGVLTGEANGLDPATWSDRSLLALAYLVTFGSLLGFTAFTWLLQHAPVSRVTTYAYVNPVVAVALGWAVLGEQVTPPMIAGAVLILVSVAVIVSVRRAMPPASEPEPG
ncbi:MAG: EamA family transporter [Chloroflexi bacterium]|nr:EamA family transporter [Chloroflexota bacterium]